MGKKQKLKHANHRNEKLYQAMLELRRSSAASPHDPRPHRERSRNAAKKAAIRKEQE